MLKVYKYIRHQINERGLKKNSNKRLDIRLFNNHEPTSPGKEGANIQAYNFSTHYKDISDDIICTNNPVR